MKMSDAYLGSIKVLKRYAKENPGKLVPVNDTKVSIDEVVDALKKVHAWVHPELVSESLVKVVRCKNCRNYKSYRKKGVYKAPSFKMCCLDRTKREPDFFCAQGEER